MDDNQNFEQLGAFIDYLNELRQKDRVRILDLARLKEIQDAYHMLSTMLMGENPDTVITYAIDEAGAGEASINIETDEIIVGKNNIEKYISSIRNVSNFEIYPLTNGLIRMSIMFYGVFKEIQ